MLDDRAALVRLLEHLEGAEQPIEWRKRLHRRWEISQCESLIEWSDARADGPKALRWSPLSTGLVLSCLGPLLVVLPQWIGHRPALDIALRFGLAGALALLGVLLQARHLWAASEKAYAQWVARARQLSPGPADAHAPPLPAGQS
jgi:hypothetical protein